MTIQELYNTFKLKVWNRNFLEDDFILLVNEGLRNLSHLWKNYYNFANSYLYKEKVVSYYKDKNWIYINMTDLESDVNDILDIEWQIYKDWNKVYIDLDFVNIVDDNKVRIKYVKVLPKVSAMTDNIDLWTYIDALLNYIIAEYYLLKTKEPQLEQYYKQKVLLLLQI